MFKFLSIVPKIITFRISVSHNFSPLLRVVGLIHFDDSPLSDKLVGFHDITQWQRWRRRQYSRQRQMSFYFHIFPTHSHMMCGVFAVVSHIDISSMLSIFTCTGCYVVRYVFLLKKEPANTQPSIHSPANE